MADKFPKKTDEVLGGNRLRSSIEMEMLKAPKKSISLPQSKCPLIKTFDCIKQSLGAVEVDVSYSMPPQLFRTGCFQGLILTSWSSLNIIKPIMSLFPQRMRQSLTLTQIVWISLSLSGSYPVKVSSLRDLEVQSRDMIRILSHAEIFSFAAVKYLQSGNMDWRAFMKTLNPCLWQSWILCPWPLYRLSAFNK